MKQVPEGYAECFVALGKADIIEPSLRHANGMFDYAGLKKHASYVAGSFML